ncbi:FmdE family protein [Methanocaldococcus sp. 28A]
MELEEDLRRTVEFHGHLCVGLALGYRVAKYVKKYYKRSEDEELVAIVYNNSCSVDAIQYLLGCTFGKGNLIFKDYGKHVYIFFSRENENKKGLKITFKDFLFEEINETRDLLKDIENPEEKKKYIEDLKNKCIEKILSLSDEDLLIIKEVEIPEPKKAKIYPSIKCEECGEYFMEIKGRLINGKIVCIECFKKLIEK